MHIVGLRLRGLDRGAVREQRMRGVAQVLEIDLPVAVIGMLEHAASCLDLAVGGAVDQVVERARHGAEPFLQVRAVGRFAREHEAAVAFHPRHRLHRHFRVADLEVARIAVIERHGFQPAVEMIGPAVVAAGELVRRALLGGHHHGAAVGALVADHAQFAVLVARHHHRMAADLRREIIAGLLHLAFVADVDPRLAEDARHLQIEDRRIGVELPVHAAGLEEAGEVLFCKSLSHAGDFTASRRRSRASACRRCGRDSRRIASPRDCWRSGRRTSAPRART